MFLALQRTVDAGSNGNTWRLCRSLLVKKQQPVDAIPLRIIQACSSLACNCAKLHIHFDFAAAVWLGVVHGEALMRLLGTAHLG
jgi:hypothetical protein